jgi:hypothetical protein
MWTAGESGLFSGSVAMTRRAVERAYALAINQQPMSNPQRGTSDRRVNGESICHFPLLICHQ